MSAFAFASAIGLIGLSGHRHLGHGLAAANVVNGTEHLRWNYGSEESTEDAVFFSGACWGSGLSFDNGFDMLTTWLGVDLNL